MTKYSANVIYQKVKTDIKDNTKPLSSLAELLKVSSYKVPYKVFVLTHANRNGSEDSMLQRQIWLDSVKLSTYILISMSNTHSITLESIFSVCMRSG